MLLAEFGVKPGAAVINFDVYVVVVHLDTVMTNFIVLLQRLNRG